MCGNFAARIIPFNLGQNRMTALFYNHIIPKALAPVNKKGTLERAPFNLPQHIGYGLGHSDLYFGQKMCIHSACNIGRGMSKVLTDRIEVFTSQN